MRRAAARRRRRRARSRRTSRRSRPSWPAGRVLVGPSGTEPLVRVMVEAPTAEQAAAVADRLVAAVERLSGSPRRG